MSENTTRGLTAVTPVQEKTPAEPRVRVYLQPIESDGSMAVDQYEHVTVDGKTDLVKRGEHVEVTVPTFLQLKQKYPYL